METNPGIPIPPIPVPAPEPATVAAPEPAPSEPAPSESELFGPAPGPADFAPIVPAPPYTPAVVEPVVEEDYGWRSRAADWVDGHRRDIKFGAVVVGLAALVIAVAFAVPGRLKGAFAPEKPAAVATAPAVPAPDEEAADDEDTTAQPAVPAPTEPATASAATAPAFGPPTGATISLGCSIPQVDDTEAMAVCEWAREGGVVFEGLRWDGDVLRGVLVVTLVDGRVYASDEMEVTIRAKAPIALAAR